jgi:type I restriction enzyme S subunit
MSKPWPKVKLAEVLRRSEETIELQPNAGYRQITVKLWGKGVVLRGILTGAEIAASRQMVARHGQFILSRIDARNGALGIVPPELDEAIVTNDFPVFNIVENRLLPTYLGWMCRTASFVEECKRASEGTTNRVRLQEDKFLAREIQLPPLADQRRVVARIEELAGQIQEACTLRQKAAEEATALPVAYSLYQFSSSTSDWKQLSILDGCEEMIDYRGRTPPISDAGIPHITSANIKGGRINWHTNKFVTEETYSAFMTRGIPKPQDVLFTMEAPLGEVGVVPDDRRFSLAQRVILLRPRADILLGEFLAKVLTSPAVRDEIVSKATATTVAGIASKRLKLIRIPVPPLPVQRRIVAESDALRTEVDALKCLQDETATELGAFLPSVLSKAFAGEL